MTQEKFNNYMETENTLIVLDTNVLLDLSKYSLHTSRNLLDIFEECLDLLWIPNHVLKEFEDRKYQVFGDAQKKYKKFQKDLKNGIDESSKRINNLFKNAQRYRFIDSDELEKEIQCKFESIQNMILNYSKKVEFEIKAQITSGNDLLSLTDAFLVKLKERNQIGKEISLAEKVEILQEGEVRYRYLIPPGFKDEGKRAGASKFGDLFIWKEILKLPQSRDKQNIIFITNDEKEDWWDCCKGNDQKIHKELLKEFAEFNPSRNIVFLTVARFQDFASNYFDLYELNVYLELNRNDVDFINRIKENVLDELIEEIIDSGDYYLEGNFGSEQIDEYDFYYVSCDSFSVISKQESKDGITLTYELGCELKGQCTSYDYWGRDDDTKEVLLSPPRYHDIEGEIFVTISRDLDKSTILGQNNSYYDFDISRGELVETSSRYYDYDGENVNAFQLS